MDTAIDVAQKWITSFANMNEFATKDKNNLTAVDVADPVLSTSVYDRGPHMKSR